MHGAKFKAHSMKRRDFNLLMQKSHALQTSLYDILKYAILEIIYGCTLTLMHMKIKPICMHIAKLNAKQG